MRNIQNLLSRKKSVDQYLSLKEHQLSAFHFSSIFLWQDFFDFQFETINDSLCIFANQKGSSFLYLPPLAKQWDEATVEACFVQMNKVNPRTARIENMEEGDISRVSGSYKVHVKASEYVYRRQDLVELKGHAYKSQRHDIHHFKKSYQSLFRPIHQDDIKACLRLYEDWARSRAAKHQDEIYCTMLEENRIVHELALVYQDQLDLCGFVVDIDKKIKAYSLGYMLNSKTFCVLLEITDTTINGLAAFIYNQVCGSQAAQEARFINSMDDFGMPFVASSKEAYHPSHKPVSYSITENK